MTNNKITIDEVADMLGASNIPPEIDYRISECATKGTVAVVYFYEDKLNDQDQKTSLSLFEFVQKRNADKYQAITNNNADYFVQGEQDE